MSPLQVARPVILDLLATIAFAAVFFIARNLLQFSGIHSVYAATGAGIGIGLVQLVVKKMSREKIGPLQWLSLVVVMALGLMTIVTHDEHFIKLKPSVIDLTVGLFMASRDWMTPYLPIEARQYISRRAVVLTSNAWAALMISFATVNALVAFYADFAVWALYSTFVPTGIIIVLFLIQYAWFNAMIRRQQGPAVA